ncbi:ASCH domain-containing protein [Enterococcus sp. LJL128]|uniref:ASCH domain-containing protein n=1 Tax=Enterococcus sp. LJL51 TaxID=3416656 RepID=UPI003CFB77DE
MNHSAEILWQDFSEKQAVDINSYHTAWAFGSSKEMADKLLQLVLSGEKRGTAAIKRSYELENEKVPEAGDYSILLDGNGEAQAIIQAKLIDILPYNQVTELHAYLEGEGDRNLVYWREGHRAFFEAELQEANEKFSEDQLVVYELFEVVYRNDVQ